MVVVADASPLIALHHLSHLNILPTLFGEILLPPEVIAELRDILAPDAHGLLNNPPPWMIVKAPSSVEPLRLDPGEAAAICLAMEIHADLLIIDEKKGRRLARSRNLPIIGTVGILELAAYRNLLDLEDEFLRLKESGFWVSDALLNLRLDIHRKNKDK
jgi:predicted nucleic acid-binding protein